MAYSYQEFTGDGTTQTFTIPFNYALETEVNVFVDGTALTTSDFTFSTSNTISINNAPALNAVVRIERITDLTNRSVDFVDGAVLSEADLDTAVTQVFHGAQEAIDTAKDAVSLDPDGTFDAQNRRIKNVADPSAAQDAATKNYIENVWLTPSDKTQLNNLNLTNLNTVATNVSDVNTAATNITDVNTVASDIANVNTVAGDSADIQTLAAISTDITTAAGISSDITTVAAKAAAVQKVADDLNETVSEVETVANDLNEITSEIDTVANSITNVDTVGTNIGNVNTVAGISANVTSVAGNASNINAAVANAANINAAVSNENNITAVAGNTTNINAVNANSTNINAVAGNNTNISTVATNNANVTTVASNIADVQTAATNVSDIQTIAAEVQKVITVANDLNEVTSEIDTVAASITNVDAVGADIANVNAVAGNATNINAVNANSTNINAVNANATNINTVAGAATNINTVASNITDVNSFADTYSIGSTAPTSPTAGDLWFDTSTGVNTMKVYNGSSWQNAGSSVNGTSARFKYTATANQTTFSGADANGDTLAYDAGYIDVFLNGIHLDPTDYTATNGTSIVLGSGAALNDELYVVAFGTFTLADHYSKTDSDSRFVNASGDTMTGNLDVTGTVTADGLTVDGDLKVTGGNKIYMNTNEDAYIAGDSNSIDFYQWNVGGTGYDQNMTILDTGNVGIGTSSPSTPLEVHGADSSGRILLSANDTPMITNGFDKFTSGSYQGAGRWGLFMEPNTLTIGVKEGSGNIAFKQFNADSTSTERMRIDASGNVTKPNSVAFYALNSGTGSQAGDGITSSPAQFVNVVLNRGNGYNTSTHRFTAPVTGLYTFSGNPGYKQNNIDFAVRLQKNGTDVTDVIRSIGGNLSHSGWAFCATIYLAANDYVELNMAAAGSLAYHRNNTSVPNWFAGYLVG